MAVVYPQLEVLTRDARAILKPEVPLASYVRQSANVGGFIVGLLIGRR